MVVWPLLWVNWKLILIHPKPWYLWIKMACKNSGSPCWASIHTMLTKSAQCWPISTCSHETSLNFNNYYEEWYAAISFKKEISATRPNPSATQHWPYLRSLLKCMPLGTAILAALFHAGGWRANKPCLLGIMHCTDWLLERGLATRGTRLPTRGHWRYGAHIMAVLQC